MRTAAVETRQIAASSSRPWNGVNGTQYRESSSGFGSDGLRHRALRHFSLSSAAMILSVGGCSEMSWMST